MIIINTSIVIALISIVISALSFLVNDIRDRNKMAIKVISKFNSFVVLKLRKASKENINNQSEYCYSALKNIVQLYAYIDCGLANKKLVKKYLKPDLIFVVNDLSFIINGFLKNSTFKPITIRYLKVMNKLGFSNNQLIDNGDVK